MIESKKLGLIAAVSLALAILLTVLMTAFAYSPAAEAFEAKYEPAYASQIFGADVISIDIVADGDDWQNMLDNAMSEEYISADVIINNKKISNVGIRPKGNNSLQQVASSDSDRYSFKIKFDEFVSGQTCYGLDMLVLNDMLGDAACMKEYTAFDMMREMGVETPYFGYAMITLNGEDWGLYFALEAYSDSYKQRVSGDTSGNLYNVKAAEQGGFNQAYRDAAENSEHTPDTENRPAAPEAGNAVNAGNVRDRDFGGEMGAANSGGSLVYNGDSIDSYSAIFGNAVGNGSDEEDYRKVIAALKALDSGENIEEYFDVDEILRYLAVHTVTVNLDSYSSNMAQNYYIYEYDGVLRILPWDYNYAWGAFQSRNASDVVNFPMDTPLSGAEMSERPLISKLFENEEYFERYHKYMRELLDGYFADGKFEAKIDGIDGIIGKCVQKDPTAFYTYEEYRTALAAFKNIGNLRAESLYGQLDGTVPSTSEGQTESPDRLIDSSSVNLSELGSGMGGGFGRDGFDKGGFRGEKGERPGWENGNGGFPQDGNRDFKPPSFGENAADGGLPQGDGEPVPAAENGKGLAEDLAVSGICFALLLCASAGVSLIKRKY